MSFAFKDDEVETLARMEYARWCAEQLLAGWTLGPEDKLHQVSPLLVPYDQLEDKVKEFNLEAIRNITRILWE